MDDRTIPKTGRSYAYCSAGTHELCKGFSAKRQSQMLKSHQNLGFGRSAPPAAESQPTADPVSLPTGQSETSLKIGFTHVHTGFGITYEGLVLEQQTTNPNEDTHGSSKK